MAQVKLYDTTLRDGMGGHGMSLSVEEKLKVVAGARRARRPLHRGRLPQLQPEGSRVLRPPRRARARELDDRRLRHDPARRASPPPKTRRSTDPGRLLRADGLPGRQELAAAPREGDPRLPRGEPGDDRATPSPSAAPRASGWSSTPSTSSTATATTRPTRSSACAPPPTPAPRTSPSATPTAAACPPSSARRRRPWSRRWATDVEIGIHTHNDAECAVANSLAAVEAGARLVQGTVNGYGERCGNANLASILPALQLKMGFDVVGDEQLASLTATAHYLDELCNMAADPDQPYVGRNAFAHKAGMHAAGVAADASTFEHLDPARGRQRPRDPRLGAVRQGDDPHPGGAGRASSSTTRRRRARSSGSRSASTAATTTRRRRPPSSSSCARRRAATRPSSSSRASR